MHLDESLARSSPACHHDSPKTAWYTQTRFPRLAAIRTRLGLSQEQMALFAAFTITASRDAAHN